MMSGRHPAPDEQPTRRAPLIDQDEVEVWGKVPGGDKVKISLMLFHIERTIAEGEVRYDHPEVDEDEFRRLVDERLELRLSNPLKLARESGSWALRPKPTPPSS
jgi:hypothetical protein